MKVFMLYDHYDLVDIFATREAAEQAATVQRARYDSCCPRDAEVAEYEVKE